MRWLGQSQRAFDMLCERAVSRDTHGSVLAEKQMVQDWVATSAAEMQAARLLTLQAAWTMDQVGASNARVEIAMIKYWGARVLHDVIDRAIQVHGSLGFSGDLPLEQMYRAARAARIYDGPDEVHKATVARRILRGYHAGGGTDRARADPGRGGEAQVRGLPRRRDRRPVSLLRALVQARPDLVGRVGAAAPLGAHGHDARRGHPGEPGQTDPLPPAHAD